MMEDRRKQVLEGGIPASVDAFMGRFFTLETLAGGSEEIAAIRKTILATNSVAVPLLRRPSRSRHDQLAARSPHPNSTVSLMACGHLR
jgi:hypothetical protein